jgi:hypothetical protein
MGWEMPRRSDSEIFMMGSGEVDGVA